MTRYFLALFGGSPTKKPRIEDGYYDCLEGVPAFNDVCVGDALLLYCAYAYAHPSGRCIAGSGIVSKKVGAMPDMNGRTFTLYYDYLPFDHPITRDHVLKCLTAAESKNFQLLHHRRNWLIEICQHSYRCITAQGHA